MQSTLRTMIRSRALYTSYRSCASPSATQALRASVAHSRMLHIKRYTAEHEFVNYDDATGVGIVSITDHAQSVLGDVVFVELPAVGSEFALGEQLGAVESVKAASDIYAPVSGKVVEINKALSEQPGLLNKSAENKGWLCKIKLADPSELKGLMTFEQYRQTYED